jgi:outer membrane protein insertion porin family
MPLGGRFPAARPWRPLAAVLAVLAIFAPGSAPAQEAQEGAPSPVIAEIRVLGNERADESLILQAFGFKPGDTYQIDRLRSGIRNLYRQGLFRDVKIEAERSEKGLVLIVRVQENPTLLRVRYEGADKLDEDDFKEVVQLVAGQTVSPRGVDQARRDLLGLYHDKGYLLAEVEPELKGDRRADLVFHIKEGKKVQVAKIEFSGNHHVSSDKLREAMKTREDRWWRGADFKKDVFEEDKKQIVSRLGQEGYVDARIVDVQQTFGEDKSKLSLTIQVEEGEPYTVGTIAVDHGKILPDSRVKGAVRLYEHMPFNTVAFDQSISDLYSLFQEEGYIYADVEAKKTPREGHVIDVDFAVTERDPAHIRRILVTGTRGRTRTHPPGAACRARGCLQALEGDPQPARGVSSASRGHHRSRPADRETGDIDLVVDVKEKQTGTASLGAGVNSASGLTGFVQLSQNNFRGRGQIVSVRGEIGGFREYNLSFTEPWLFDTPTSAGFDLFDTRHRYTEYDEKRRGVELRVGRPFPWLDYTRIQGATPWRRTASSRARASWPRSATSSRPRSPR